MPDLRSLARILALVLAVLAPVAGFAVAAGWSAGRLLNDAEAARARAAAAGAAAAIDARLDGIGASLRAGMDALRLEDMSDAELEGALRLFYAQEPVVSAITLLDEKGAALLPSVHLTRLPAGSGGRDGVTVEELAQFAAHIPLAAALERGEAFGASYRSDRRAAWLAAYARVVPVEEGAARWVLAVELNLRFVADLCVPGAEAAGASLRVRGAGGATLAEVGSAAPAGGATATATAAVPAAGWTVEAAVPVAHVLGVPSALAGRLAFWGGAAALVALLLAAAAGEALRRRARTLALSVERRARALAAEHSGDAEMERAVALGRLASRLQHELANPLAAIKAATEILGAAGAAGDPETAQALGAAIERCEQVVRRLAQLAHTGAEPPPAAVEEPR
ncbi:MAG TPA: histidine kinase dimerization/phospho-acceptor domain-containing protein [Myxococcota bacterium]|jgi:hypothetical protein|nr:histidine kinase dimerization/phospho-acceptor domain-containing protein [Myxococcota bacterium]